MHVYPMMETVLRNSLEEASGYNQDRRSLTDIPGSTIAAALTPYMMEAPHNQTAFNIKNKSIMSILEAEKEAAKKFPALLIAMRSIGYLIDICLATQEQQKKNFIERAAREFKDEQKMRENTDRRIFDKSKLRSPKILTEKSYNDSPFLYSWTLVTPHNKKMCDSGLLRKVSYAESALAIGDQVQRTAVWKDANQHIIIVAMGRYNDHENSQPAKYLDLAVGRHIAVARSEHFTSVETCSKGGAAAFIQTTLRAQVFYDVSHLKKCAENNSREWSRHIRSLGQCQHDRRRG